MPGVDLHIHSNNSDGKYSPEELVRKSVERGLTYIALTDHDNVDGIPPWQEAARNYSFLTAIPGLEISTDIPSGEVHILGYFIDYKNTMLAEKLSTMRESRVTRARRMIEKLGMLGMTIDWTRVRELAEGSSVGRPHIAQALQEKGYVSTLKEAFEKYISRDGPAYVERDKMTPEEAVRLIVSSGGLPVLAHPLTLNNLEAILPEMVKAGLSGLEIYYSGYPNEDINYLLTLANRYGLIPTGGSDYHGFESNLELGDVSVPIEVAQRLIDFARKAGIKVAE